MPIKESPVNTNLLDYRGQLVHVPVFFTDELLEASVYDLAYESVLGEYLPYIFVAHITFPEKDSQKWFFANARRHDDLYQALMKEIKEDFDYNYGQFNFEARTETGGRLQFYLLQMHKPFENEKGALNTLTRSVRRELFGDHIILTTLSLYGETKVIDLE